MAEEVMERLLIDLLRRLELRAEEIENIDLVEENSRFRVEPRSKSSDDVLRVPQLPPRNYSCDEELLSKLQSNSENPAHSSDLNDSYANQLRMQAIKFNPHQTQSTGNARTGQRSRQSPNLIHSKGDSSSMLSIDNFHHNRPLLTSSPVAPSDDDLEYNKNPAESPKLVRTPEKRFKETSFPASPEIPLPPHPSKDNYNCSYIDDDGEPFPSPPLPPGPPPRMSPSFDSNGNKMILNPHSYSSESYMSNRTQRVPFGGFAGNYKRSNSSTFPVSATAVSTHRPGQSHTTDFTPSVTSNDQDNSSKQPYLDGNMDAENEENEITRQPVKAFVANFERPRRFHTPERDSEKPRHPRAQVAALTARFGGSRENLTRSNESLNGSTENVCDNKTLKGSYETTNEDQTAKRQPLVHQKQNGNYHNNYSDSERPGEIISSSSVVTPSRTISVPTTPHTPQSSHNKAPQIIHVRQKSQEEIECEEHAKMLADELKKKDRKLSEVISPPQYHKTTKDYIGDIYNDAESGLSSRRLSLGTPPSRFSIVSRINSEKTPSMSDLSDPPPMSPNWLSPDKTTQQYGSSQAMNKDLESSSLDQKKEELIFRINKKLEILENFQTTLNEDIVENNALEKQVSQIVEERCTNHKELEKYHSFVGELDKILQLMLKLSGRLARAENAVLSLPDDADKKEQTLLKSKRDRLQLQLEDARKLKDGIDRREGQVSGFLQKYLSEEEFYDFEHLVKTKSKLTLEQQDLEDKISVGTEQLKALKKSMSHNADMDDLY